MRGIVPLLLLSACGTSQTMVRVEETPVAPPPQQALVFFHRLSALEPTVLVRLFDGETPLGELRAHESCFALCDAGDHLLVAVSEGAAALEATLEAGAVYDIVCDVHLAPRKTIIRLDPLLRDDPRREQVFDWHKTHPLLRLEPRAASALREAAAEPLAAALLAHGPTGPKRNRNRKMTAEDMR